VINAPGANAIAAAEHTFGLMLAVMRNIVAGDAHVRQGGWDRARYLGQELYQKRLGIIGLGRVGRQVARIAQGFRMVVSAYDPFLSPDIFQAHDVKPTSSLEELLPNVDVLTMHTPKSGPRLDMSRLMLLPPGAVIVNAARGGLYDEAALAELLASGRLAGAGMDVFGEEPPGPASPLLHAPHVVTTPHLGGSTHEAMVEVGMMTARGVLEALSSKTPPNLVNVPIPDIPEKNLQQLDKAVRILGGVFSRVNAGADAPLVLRLTPTLSPSVEPWVKQAALAAFLQDRVDERVNTVNALLIAARQGLSLLVERDQTEGEEEALALRIEGRRDTEVAVVLSPQGVAISRVLGIPVDMVWPDRALITRHRDAPGVVGRVGTVVGKHNVNIGQLHLGRRSPQAEALMILTLDTDPSDALLAELRGLPDIVDVYAFTGF
jgi:D-3-phosphoglycerate dehydrogenase